MLYPVLYKKRMTRIRGAKTHDRWPVLRNKCRMVFRSPYLCQCYVCWKMSCM